MRKDLGDVTRMYQYESSSLHLSMQNACNTALLPASYFATNWSMVERGAAQGFLHFSCSGANSNSVKVSSRHPFVLALWILLCH